MSRLPECQNRIYLPPCGPVPLAELPEFAPHPVLTGQPRHFPREGYAHRRNGPHRRRRSPFLRRRPFQRPRKRCSPSNKSCRSRTLHSLRQKAGAAQRIGRCRDRQASEIFLVISNTEKPLVLWTSPVGNGFVRAGERESVAAVPAVSNQGTVARPPKLNRKARRAVL